MVSSRGIVAVGASAGGVEALTALIEQAPTGGGLTYLVLLHSSRWPPPHLAEILARHSSMPVSTIVDGETLESDHVYVIPPGMDLSFDADRFVLRDYPETVVPPKPIDHLFEVIAGRGDTRLYAVVLSGTGRDGAEGLQALKDAGGITFAQAPEGAGFTGMPESAVSTGLVDFVLHPSEIARKLAELDEARRLGRTLLPVAEGELDEHLDRVLAVLNFGHHDFSEYKRSTLSRRLARRMSILARESLDAYIEVLREDPQERDRLAADFLIGVTAFFRNGETHERLKALVLRPLLASDRPHFRVWSAGCASGEELYSLAMAVEELKAETGDERRWKFFGTDVDSRSLYQARRGVYGHTAVSTLSAERVERCFARVHGGFRIRRHLREMCIVAEHDLLRDPPFAHMDFIACRNVLIYLNPSAQHRVISKLHYALDPGGFLWLGPSENPGRDHELIEVDRASRIFMRREDAHIRPVLAPDQEVLRANRLGSTPTALPRALSRRDAFDQATGLQDLEKETERLFLEREAPPFARLDEDDRVVYASEGMRAFLRPNRGAPSTKLDDYFVEALRVPLRRTIRGVRANGEVAKFDDVLVNLPDAPHFYDLRVTPIKGTTDLMINLTEVRSRDHGPEIISAALGAEADYAEEITRLRRELRDAEKGYTIAERELRAINEELMSMNEELQVANEELETSREELQAVNEELAASNSELLQRNTELADANSDFENLLESTAIPTLFLDGQGKVRQFTRQLGELFSVQRQDIGRDIGDFTGSLHYPDLLNDHRQVQRSLVSLSRSVSSSDHTREYEVRVRPYRSGDGQIDGSVMTFRETTTERRRAERLEQALESAAQRNAILHAFFESAPFGMSVTDLDMRYLRINSRLAALNGVSVDETIGRIVPEIVPELYEAALKGALATTASTGRSVRNLRVVGSTAADPMVVRKWLMDCFPILDEQGTLFAVGTIVVEVTEIEELRSELSGSGRESLQLMAAMNSIRTHLPICIVLSDAEGRLSFGNQALQDFLVRDFAAGRPIDVLLAPLDGASLSERIAAVIERGEPQLEMAVPVRLLGGAAMDVRRLDLLIAPAPDEQGGKGAMIALHDRTEFVAAQEQNASNDAHRLRTILDGLASYAALTTPEGTVLDVNAPSLDDAGLRREDVLDHPFWDAPWWSDDPARSRAVRDALDAAARGQVIRLDVPARLADGTLRTIAFQVAPVMDLGGTVVNLVPSGVDIQDQLDAIAQKDALLVELQHLTDNVIATVQAILQFIFDETSDPQAVASAITGHLACLTRCYRLLASGDWSGISLEQLLDAECGALQDGGASRVHLQGDDVVFSPEQAIFVALGLHELIADSRRRGALSSDADGVHVHATVRDGMLQELLWSDQAEPVVAKSGGELEGLGLVLLQELLGPALSLETEHSVNASGLRFRFFRRESSPDEARS